MDFGGHRFRTAEIGPACEDTLVWGVEPDAEEVGDAAPEALEVINQRHRSS